MASKKDKQILESILDPNVAVGEAVYADDDENEFELVPSDDESDDGNVKESKKLEAEGVKAAEAGDIQLALQLFGEAVQSAPGRPSPYNNRAQALRLKGVNSNNEEERKEDEKAALDDLNKAIELCAGRRCRTARQSFCQRGLLHRLEGKTDEAIADLSSAAKLGSQFARRQLVAINPYAAMCNQMLSQVIGKLQNPSEAQ